MNIYDGIALSPGLFQESRSWGRGRGWCLTIPITRSYHIHPETDTLYYWLKISYKKTMFIKSKAYCSALSFIIHFAEVETKDLLNEIRLQNHNPGFVKHFREYCFSGKNGMLVTNNTLFWNPFKARALGTAFLQYEWLCPSLHHHVTIYNYMDVRAIWNDTCHLTTNFRYSLLELLLIYYWYPQYQIFFVEIHR